MMRADDKSKKILYFPLLAHWIEYQICDAILFKIDVNLIRVLASAQGQRARPLCIYKIL